MMLKRKNIRTKNAAAAVNIIMTNTIMTSMTTTTAAADTAMTIMDIRTVTDAPAAHTETMTKRKKASI